MVHHLRESSLFLSPKPFDHPSKICQNTVRRASECKKLVADARPTVRANRTANGAG